MKKIVLLFCSIVIMSGYAYQMVLASDNTIICQNSVYTRCDLAKDGQTCADDSCAIFSLKVTPRGREFYQNFQTGREQGKPIVILNEDRNSVVISPKWKLSSWDSQHTPIAESFGVTYFKDNVQCKGSGSGILNINRHLGTDKKVNDEFIKQQIDSIKQQPSQAVRSFGLISESGGKAFDICFKIKQSVTTAQLYADLLNASTTRNPLPLAYELIYKHQLN